MIEARGLTKHYGRFRAADDVHFSVAQGQVCAFLGPNGAGKSTTMKMLMGYLAPTAGSARVAGFEVATERREAAARTGYLPENGPLYLEMTPLSSLRFFGSARGLSGARLKERIDTVLEQCALGEVVEKPIRKLSKGYRQRAGMAQALLHDPEVLILDEPTTGLDPNQIREVRRLIRELAQSKTILLSTHILQEVEAVCDHVVLLRRGRVVYDGTPEQMREGHASLDEAFHARTADPGTPAEEPAA